MSNVTSSNCAQCSNTIYVQGCDWHSAKGHLCIGCGGLSVLAHKFNSEPKPLEPVVLRKCVCGAKFTTFPNQHSNWCDIK